MYRFHSKITATYVDWVFSTALQGFVQDSAWWAACAHFDPILLVLNIVVLIMLELNINK